jgi:hypothetical protein
MRSHVASGTRDVKQVSTRDAVKFHAPAHMLEVGEGFHTQLDPYRGGAATGAAARLASAPAVKASWGWAFAQLLASDWLLQVILLNRGSFQL